jgi:hypothetical protein
LDKTIGSVVAAGWKACQEAIAGVKPKVDETAKAQLAPIAEVHAKLLAQIQQGATSILTEGLGKIADPIFQPLIEKLIGPTIQCFTTVVKTWKNKMGEKCTAETAKEISTWSWSYWLMSDAWKPIWDFARSDAMRVMSDLLHGFDSWRFENAVEGFTSQLMKKAAFTFQEISKENGGNLEEARDQTSEMLLNDSRLGAKKFILDILTAIVNEPFRRIVVPLLKDVLEPVKSIIPDPLKEVIDVDDIADRVMKKAVIDSVANTATPIIESQCMAITA